MNTRLQQFLELEDLSPARLADLLGVQRSGVSHILSGRNKPGYEFLHKLLTRFPSISADWLLTGKGKPYKEMNRVPAGGDPSVSVPVSAPVSPIRPENPELAGTTLRSGSGFSSADPVPERPDAASSVFSSGTENPTLFDNTADYTEEQDNTSRFEPEYPAENATDARRRPSVREKKEIKRVIVFYSDGSFEELMPLR